MRARLRMSFFYRTSARPFPSLALPTPGGFPPKVRSHFPGHTQARIFCS